MARQFNGTSDYLVSASAINLSAFQKAGYSFWLWVDTYTLSASHGALAQYQSGAGNPPRVRFYPDTTSAGWYTEYVDSAASTGEFTRPSASAWHHYVVNVDVTKASSEIDSIYVDGSSVSVTRNSDGNNTGNLPAHVISLMADSVGGPADFLAGRIAEVAIWPGILLSGSDVSALYNGGNGALATSVQSGSLAHYWRILGTSSPEPATVGGIDLTVNGATQVAHPFTVGGSPTLVGAVIAM